MAPFIEFDYITDALQGFVRPHREGREAVRNIICVNVRCKPSGEVTVVTFCVRTTAINDDPVEIEVIIDRKTEVVSKKIKFIKCGCSSGSSKEHCCKHASATLTYLERHNKKDIELLTCTDTEQVWEKLKDKTLSQYEPTPIRDFCHIVHQKSSYKRSILDPTSEMEAEFRAMYLTAQPSPEGTVFKKGTRYKPPREPASIKSVQNVASQAWANTSFILKKGEEIGLKLYSECTPEEKYYFDSNIKVTEEDALKICQDTVEQCDEVRRRARYGRITESGCYSLYTYSKNKSPNWDRKLETTFNSEFTENSDTERRLMYEDDAREKYESDHKNFKLISPGLMINPIVPWLGYVADGVICNESEAVRLWECKAPRAGKDSGRDTISTVLEYTDKTILKLKHIYYGQIQLGMLLTSTHSCDFTTYCYGFDQVHIKDVVLNETFSLDLINVLTNTYYKHILPWVVKQSSG